MWVGATIASCCGCIAKTPSICFPNPDIYLAGVLDFFAEYFNSQLHTCQCTSAAMMHFSISHTHRKRTIKSAEDWTYRNILQSGGPRPREADSIEILFFSLSLLIVTKVTRCTAPCSIRLMPSRSRAPRKTWILSRAFRACSAEQSSPSVL